VCVKNAQNKLEEYYKLMQESPVYAASVVLNPQHKKHWFNFHWKAKRDWIEKAEKNVENLWLTKYKDPIQPQDEASIIHSTADKDPSDFDQFMAPLDYYNDEENQTNEYEQYLADPRQSREAAKKLSLCKFWASQESSYPLLSRMAFDMLSIPAMSAECERTFSSTKLLLTDRRARMKEDIIEASECLRAGFKDYRFERSSGAGQF